MNYIYDAKLVRIIDGDTVVLRLEKTYTQAVDFGFYITDEMTLKKSTTLSFRLAGIDTPEVVGATKTAGIAAKVELERLLGLGAIEAHTGKPDKYGRWLVTLYVTQPDGIRFNANQALIDGGFAVPYMV